MKKLYSLLIMMALFTLSAWAQSWVLTAASDLQTGDVVVIAETTIGHAMSNDKGTSSAPSAVSITFDTDKSEITSTVTDNLKWTVTVSNGSYQFNATENTWLYTTNTNNGVRVGDNANKTFTIDATSGYLKNSATNRFLGVYDKNHWRCYTSINANITGQEFAFFKYVAPVTEEFTVTATPAPGTYDAPQTVTLATQNATGDVLMYYTLDGTDPETSATQIEYTAPFAINETKTLRVYAMDDGDHEATFEGEYTITPLTITADPAAGTYAGTQTVTLSASTEVTEWAWEFTPTGGTKVEGTTNTVTVDQSGSLYVLATDSYNRTAEATFAYTITEAPQEATFIFNTEEGLQELGISKPSAGAGTNLDGQSFTKAPITVSFAQSGGSTEPRVYNSNGTLTLRLYKNNVMTITAAEGYKISSIVAKSGNTTDLSTTPETPQQEVVFTPTATVQTGTITVAYIEEAPVFGITATPEPGAYDAPQTVTLATKHATGESEIHYTLDGSDPKNSETSQQYTAPIAINKTATLKVYALDEELNEATFEGEYTITPLTITADPDAGTYTGTQTVTLSANAEVTEWAWEFTPTGGTAVEGTTNTVTVDQTGSLYVLATDTYGRTAEATFAYTIKEPVVVDGTIIFKSNDNDGSALNAETFADQITKGADEVESVTAEKVYAGVNGLKFSSSSSNGTLTLNLAKKWNLNKVSVIACNWANANDRYDAGKLKVTVNGQDSTFTLKDEYEKFDLPLTGANNVTTLTFDATNRIYLKVVDLDGTPVVTTDLADILAGEDDASYNVTEELAVLNVFDKVGYATINVAGNKDFIALDFSDTDITPAEGTVYGNISGTLSSVKTNPVLKVTAAEVTNATVVAEPMTVDLTQVFYVPGNAFVTVAGYVDANGKLRAYNTLETHGGQSIDLDRSLLTQNLALVEGKKYIFNGVMTLKEAWTESTGAPRRVASGDLEGRYYDNYTFTATAVEEAPVITGVDNIAAGKEVKTVRYFDVAGRASAQPVQGVNIVVVEYQDGTQSVSKVVR